MGRKRSSRRVFTARLDPDDRAWLQRAGREMTAQLRADLDDLRRLLWLAQHKPHITIQDAVELTRAAPVAESAADAAGVAWTGPEADAGAAVDAVEAAAWDEGKNS